MQLPRVVIAAVFFVIGALIAIPALVKAVSPSSEPSASATTSPSESPSASPSGSKPKSKTSLPKPGLPLVVTISGVSCPSRTVNITVRNTGTQSEDFGIEKNDDTAAIPGQIRPKSTRTIAVTLREDRATRVTINWANKRIEATTVKANCKKAVAAPPPSTPKPHKTPPSKLPHTGPDTALWARAATGVGILLTGAIIFWYGGVWPRRRDQIFAKKS